MDWLRNWWKWDGDKERSSEDNPVAPLDDSQRRGTGPLLTLAFGWGFLVTGLFTGGALGSGQVFWPDLVAASLAGNTANFLIGAVVQQEWKFCLKIPEQNGFNVLNDTALDTALWSTQMQWKKRIYTV